MRRSRRRKTINNTLILILLLSISIGYAFLSSNLNIIGTTEITNPTWDIHFENVEVKEGSVTSPEPTIDTNKTTVSYSVTLNLPGDYFEFTVDVINSGTIDGMIDEISNNLNNEEIDTLPPYLEYTISYDDGLSLAENQILEAGDSETIKIHVAYKKDLTSDELPETEQTLNFKLTITYVQADDNALDVNHSTLYNVLKSAAGNSFLAREYTGEHHDSFTEEPSKKIYHWYATNSTQGTQVLDKNNVIFAGQCFQMIRTTDTGGVKMIYNGEAEEGQCLNTRGIHIGFRGDGVSSSSLSTSYYYGTSFEYNSDTSEFILTGEVTTGEIKKHQYTCLSSSSNSTCEILHYVIDKYGVGPLSTITVKKNNQYSDFGEVSYSPSSRSLSSVSYKYGNANSGDSIYFLKTNDLSNNKKILERKSLSTSYWYADNYNYDDSTGMYSLVNPFKVSSSSEYSNLIGKYTFYNSSQNYTSSSIYYIGATSSSYSYCLELIDNQPLSNFTPLALGDTITSSNDNNYTINNIEYVDINTYYSNYSNYINKYYCDNNKTSCENPKYIVSTNSNNFSYIDNSTFLENILIAKERNGMNLVDTLMITKHDLYMNFDNYSDYKYTCRNTSSICTLDNLSMIYSKSNVGYNYIVNFNYGENVSWDGEKYTLVNPVGIESFKDNNTLASHHYFCLSGDITCENVAYIYYKYPTNSSVFYYVLLSNGIASINDFMNEFLSTNRYDSIIKQGIDAWYYKYISDFTDYLEDTIFCNDRSIKNYGGWNSQTGIPTYILEFRDTSDSLDCPNITDQFSIYNNKALLEYPVALATKAELNLLNEKTILKTGNTYALLTPYKMQKTSQIGNFEISRVGDNGEFNKTMGLSGNGGHIRPVISLKPKTKYISGTGTMADPYVVDTSN